MWLNNVLLFKDVYWLRKDGMSGGLFDLEKENARVSVAVDPSSNILEEDCSPKTGAIRTLFSVLYVTAMLADVYGNLACAKVIRTLRWLVSLNVLLLNLA